MRHYLIGILLATALCAGVATRSVTGQQEGKPRHERVAKRSDIYCTGFISELSPRADLKIIGAERESTRRYFAQGDIVFLNKGRAAGVYPGALYYVIRPLGKFRHPFNEKKKLGYYVRELGMLRVIEVQEKTATAEITVSCDTMTFGDALRPYELYEGPAEQGGRPLNRFGEGSADTVGQIVLAPGFHEFLAENRIVHIDLGNRQGIQAGDRFTIFRKIGSSENILPYRDDRTSQNRHRGFGSDRYRGGDLSIDAVSEKPTDVFATRPEIPRKVLGELVVLKVENTAAVAMITRSLSEINIGDFIERAN